MPSDVERWSDVLTTRVQCLFDTFSTFTPYAITRTQTMLQELYPGDSELPSRLKHEVEAAKQRSSDLNGQWLQVRSSLVFTRARFRRLPMQFKMLYDGYLLHLEKLDREKMEKAYPELERACEDVLRRARAVVAGKSRWESSFDLALTDVSTMLVRFTVLLTNCVGRVSRMHADDRQTPRLDDGSLPGRNITARSRALSPPAGACSSIAGDGCQMGRSVH